MNIVSGLTRADDLLGGRMLGRELADDGRQAAFLAWALVAGIGIGQLRAYGWSASCGWL